MIEGLKAVKERDMIHVQIENHTTNRREDRDRETCKCIQNTDRHRKKTERYVLGWTLCFASVHEAFAATHETASEE